MPQHRIHALIVLLSLLSITLGASSAVQAQFAAPGSLPAIDAKTRAMVVDSVTAVIDSVYVLGDAAQRIVAGLRHNLRRGAYDELTDPSEFAQRLEADAQAINRDNHFGIRALPPPDPQYTDGEEDPCEAERRQRERRMQNYGFRKAEILEGGVGYLRLDSFAMAGDEAFNAAAAAMNFLSSSNAVILDLRYNGGGSAAMIRFLAGYFFEERTHLINWYERVDDQIVQSYSADYVPGRRMIHQPVYILTSGRTGSAAEEFTFDLRNLERATVVGEVTGGAGHTVFGSVFNFDGFSILIRVPFGRAFNPENNEGWEGVGVTPHMAVPADQALDVAYADALRKIIDAEEDAQFRATLAWALEGLEARANPISLSPREMEDFVGRYGPRVIFVENEALYYLREGRPAFALEPMGPDLFRVGDLDYFRLTFERDADGRVVRIVGLYNNGERDANDRDGD